MIQKYIFSCFIICTSLGSTIAQQLPQFTQFYFNQPYFNPAAVGSATAPQVQLLHRAQYVGITNNYDPAKSINTQLLTFQLPIEKLKIAAGLVVTNDQIGIFNNKEIKLNIAKNTVFKNGNLALGVSLGLYNKSLQNDFRPREAGDNFIPENGFSQIKPIVGIGASFSSKIIELGISLNQLNKPVFDYGTDGGQSSLNRLATGFLALNLELTPNLIITPSALLRSDFQNNIFDGSIITTYQNKFWVGSGFRQKDALSGMAGINLLKNNALKIGFAYDAVLFNSNIKSPKSFEIFTRYYIGERSKNEKIKVKPIIIRTPRYRF